ncbi:MAG: hypothetical protein AAFW46_06925 [Pseudomonadota bacterium]
MDRSKVYDYARRLRSAHGDRAIAEAAQKAVACERRKDAAGSSIWRQIETVLRSMQGPRAT